MTTETPRDRLDRCLRQVEAHPESARARFNLGLAYTGRGQAESAEKAYRAAVELDPELVEAWVNLGGALLLQWKFEESLKANQEALARRPDLLLAHYNMGQGHLYMGDAEGVMRCNRRVIELEPDHPAAHYHLAVGLLAAGRAAEARAELARAMALGHKPAPEFLRGLEKAEKQADDETRASGDSEAGVRENAKEE